MAWQCHSSIWSLGRCGLTSGPASHFFLVNPNHFEHVMLNLLMIKRSTLTALQRRLASLPFTRIGRMGEDTNI